ncbi:hypothetical protein GUJ93_ZPchr0004g40354 [Zizania palustris]|uniref:Uncharacterized protein n=1 Tax=Zizania palustris TaxID=103762 RepID=A0A8J5SKC2_ZIZPA|nr:hypothetical protein GUJ93_ZPchr0004g40354 [Zizania palustris]
MSSSTTGGFTPAQSDPSDCFSSLKIRSRSLPPLAGCTTSWGADTVSSPSSYRGIRAAPSSIREATSMLLGNDILLTRSTRTTSNTSAADRHSNHQRHKSIRGLATCSVAGAAGAQGLVRLQATMHGRQVRKQAAMMLRCMQARIRAHRVRMCTEGHTVQKLLEAHHTKLDTLWKPSFALNVLTFLAFAQQQQKPNSYCRLNQSGILLKHQHFDKSNSN